MYCYRVDSVDVSDSSPLPTEIFSISACVTT